MPVEILFFRSREYMSHQNCCRFSRLGAIEVDERTQRKHDMTNVYPLA